MGASVPLPGSWDERIESTAIARPRQCQNDLLALWPDEQIALVRRVPRAMALWAPLANSRDERIGSTANARPRRHRIDPPALRPDEQIADSETARTPLELDAQPALRQTVRWGAPRAVPRGTMQDAQPARIALPVPGRVVRRGLPLGAVPLLLGAVRPQAVQRATRRAPLAATGPCFEPRATNAPAVQGSTRGKRLHYPAGPHYANYRRGRRFPFDLGLDPPDPGRRPGCPRIRSTDPPGEFPGFSNPGPACSFFEEAVS
jgi:hypothetical protein